MENALRQVDANITIPYWDCTLDAAMTNPVNSVIWSKNFFGNGLGRVIEGPFANWDTHFGFGALRRAVSGQRRLMSKDDLDIVMKQRFLGNISYPDAEAAQNLEQLHNNVHVWVGGLMKNIEIGAFDPVFYMLHSFVDKIWEDFRINQKRAIIDPTTDYPQYYGRASHAPMAPMGLGKLTAIDGISEVWNRRIRYTDQPKCRLAVGTNCGSDFLKCDNVKYQCVSKTKDEYETEKEATETMLENSRRQDINKHKNIGFMSMKLTDRKITHNIITVVVNENVTKAAKRKKDKSRDIYYIHGFKDWSTDKLLNKKIKRRSDSNKKHSGYISSLFQAIRNIRDSIYSKVTYLYDTYIFPSKPKMQTKDAWKAVN